jgi:prefoldin subunit 5
LVPPMAQDSSTASVSLKRLKELRRELERLQQDAQDLAAAVTQVLAEAEKAQPVTKSAPRRKPRRHK